MNNQKVLVAAAQSRANKVLTIIAIICEVRKIKGSASCSLGISMPEWWEGSSWEGQCFPFTCVNQHILYFENLNKWLENHRYFSSPTSSSIHLFDIYDIQFQNNTFMSFFIPLIKLKTSQDMRPQRILTGGPPKCNEPQKLLFIHLAQLIVHTNIRFVIHSLKKWPVCAPLELPSSEGDSLST